MKQASRTWFITGASKGVGLKLVARLLEQGHRVAATSRTAVSLTETRRPCAWLLRFTMFPLSTGAALKAPR